MSFIEGVGDEVIAFAVILLVFLFAATITFLLNSSPFSENPQVSRTNIHSNFHNQVLRRPVADRPTLGTPLHGELIQYSAWCLRQMQNPDPADNEESSQDSRHTSTTDSNNASSPNVSDNDEMQTVTEEGETVTTEEDKENCSENNTNSPIYPNISESVPPSAPDLEPEDNDRETDPREYRDPEEIHVRLKYLDDTERTVVSHPRVKIGLFKRTHFAEEIASNKVVRLIFSGQLLQDNATLQSYAVANNCVIHVQILQAQTQQNTSSLSQNTDLDLSHLLWPLLSVILGICWILYFKYPEFFNMLSLGMLFMFTGSFIYFYSQIQQH